MQEVRNVRAARKLIWKREPRVNQVLKTWEKWIEHLLGNSGERRKEIVEAAAEEGI